MEMNGGRGKESARSCKLVVGERRFTNRRFTERYGIVTNCDPADRAMMMIALLIPLLYRDKCKTEPHTEVAIAV